MPHLPIILNLKLISLILGFAVFSNTSYANTLLIEGATIIDSKSNSSQVSDVLIENGVVTKIGNRARAASKVYSDLEKVSAQGMYLSAGFIDSHVHLRDVPGYRPGRSGYS